MTGVALLLAAAALAHAAARILGGPPLPYLLVAGLLLGVLSDIPGGVLEDTLVLGVTFLLFVNGIELNPRRTRGQRSAAVKVGSLQFLLLGVAGLAAAYVIGFAGLSALYLALALTASSTLVVVQLLRQRRQLFEPFGRLVTGALLLQDLLVILLIPILTRTPDGVREVVIGITSVGLLLALTAIAWRWLPRLLARLDGDDEALLLATLVLLFFFIGLGALLGLPPVVGAFLGGVAVSGFPAAAIVRPQLTSVSDFFTAILFVALGALVGIPTPAEFLQALVIATVVVVVTPPLVTVVAEWAGLSARPAIEAGLVLAQMSELSLVVGLYGMLAGQVTTSLFTVIALATLLTMLMTPIIATDRAVWWLMHLHPVRPRAQQLPPLQDHVVVLGSGTTGMPLLETLMAAQYEVVVVDDDPDVVARLRQAEVYVIRGDATDLAVLERARARQAKIITSTIRRPEDNRRLLEYAGDVPVIVRVFEQQDADWVQALGGIPVLYSEAAAEGLMNWLAERDRAS